MRRSLALLTALALLTVGAGCASRGDAAAGTEQRVLRYQGAVGTVTLPELAADLGYLDDVSLKWIGNTTSGPQDIQAATTGDVEFGGAFNGAIVKLKAAKAPIQAVIGYYGVNEQVYGGYYVLDGSPVKSARDLIGKKIGMNTLGAHYEAVLKTYLVRNGLSDEEIKKVEPVVVPPVSTEQALRSGQIDVAVLSGTLRDKALEKGGIHPLFTDYELLGAFTAGSYVFRTEFLKKNPTTVRTFVTGVAKAIEWTRTTPREQVVARYAEILRKRARNEDDSQLKFWKSTGVAGAGGLISDQEFSTWVDWLDRSGELKNGKPALKDVFTNQFNGYKAA